MSHQKVRQAWNAAKYCFDPYAGRPDDKDMGNVALFAGLVYIADVLAEAILTAADTRVVPKDKVVTFDEIGGSNQS